MPKNSYIKHFYELNICQGMTFRLYTVYNKHEMMEIRNQTSEKSQVLSQVLFEQVARIILLPTVQGVTWVIRKTLVVGFHT